MSELFRIIASARAQRGFKPCEALLPVDDWCVVPGRLRFGLPWPWRVSDDAVEIVDGTGGDVRAEAVAQVMAPRSDAPISFGLWRDDGALEPMLPGLGGRLAASHRGDLRFERRIALGGTRAVLVGIDDPHQRIRVWRLVADWSGHLLHGQMEAPSSIAEGYAPHLETMLATWSWG